MSLGQVESRKKPYVTYVKTHTPLYFEVWIEKTQTLSRTQHVWLNVHINIYGLYISKIEILQGQPQSNWKGSGSTVWSAWQWSIKTSQVETCNLNLFCFSDTSSHAKTIFQISEWVSEWVSDWLNANAANIFFIIRVKLKRIVMAGTHSSRSKSLDHEQVLLKVWRRHPKSKFLHYPPFAASDTHPALLLH